MSSLVWVCPGRRPVRATSAPLLLTVSILGSMPVAVRVIPCLDVDARRAAGTPSGFEVTTHGGREGAGIDAVEWAARGQELGVGEILLNSMDADGTKAGFDLELIRKVRAVVDVPLIASGGAGDVA